MSLLQAHGPETAAGSIPWTGTDVARALLAMVLAIPLLAALSAVLLLGLDVSRATLALALTALVEAAMVGVAWRFSVAKYGCSWRVLGFRWRAAGGWRLMGVGLLACLGAVGVYAAVLSALGLHDLLPSAPFFLERSPGVIAVGAVLAVGVAPAAEETFFRGFIFNGLRHRLGAWGAAAASAGLFALAHLDPAVFVPIFLIGLVLAWVYFKSGSLWSAIIVHLAYNSLALALAWSL